MQNNNLELSIVMPCLNEVRTLGTCINKAKQFISQASISAEIIIADNGSVDGSQQLAESLGARVVHVADAGYGNALRGGINASFGEFVIMGDSDDSYDFSNLGPFIEKLRQGYDLVMGCRLPAGGGTIVPGAMPWKHRWLGNPVLSSLGKLFFKSPVTDFHCGLRGFRKDAYEEMRLASTGMEFASEMVIKATLLSMRITEVPITLHKDGRDRQPHLRSFRDGWRHLRLMLVFSPKWLFFFPGIFLLFAGLIGISLILPGPLHLFYIYLDINSLSFFAMLTLTGSQTVIFSILVKVYAITHGFLPASKKFIWLQQYLNLESGLKISLCCFASAAILICMAIFYWGIHDFGNISAKISSRMMISGMMLFLLSVQIFFSSFFLSILGMDKHNSNFKQD